MASRRQMISETRSATLMATQIVASQLLLLLLLAMSGENSTLGGPKAAVAALRIGHAEPKKVVVDLPALPEPFDNTKLPVKLSNDKACFSMMGCFEPLPIGTTANKPLQMGTEFLFYDQRNTETRITFEPVLNCLRSSASDCALLPLDLQALIDSPFRSARRTIIFVSGYMTKAPTDWELAAKDIWLELEDVNVIIVNWSRTNSGAYSEVASTVRLVSRQLTVLLYYLAKLNGLEVGDDSFGERIYMVGHSLGAHIAGFVGMDLGGAVGRITGLDPAGPSFDEWPARFRLDRSDAQLVDAIHSNGGAVLFSTQQRYGTGLMSGHIDLYANNGVHQPGCASDLLGCSHGKSNKYYLGFLRHEQSMRKYLADDYSSLYRLNVFASDSWERFRDGFSLDTVCPKSVSYDRELFSSDLNSCAAPVDYFTWYSHVKEELATRHGIDFSPDARQNNSYFFYTAADTDNQMDHYLVRARVRAATSNRLRARLSSFGRSNSKRALDYRLDECDLSLDIQMKKGFESHVKIEQYRLLDEGAGDYYKIVMPFLATNSITKYQVAKLDAQDYHLTKDAASGKLAVQDELQLRQELLEVFPQTLTLRGFHVREEAAKARRQERESPGFMQTIVNIFHMAKGAVSAAKPPTTDDAEEQIDGVPCELSIQHLAIRPLAKFHRSIVAHYSGAPRDLDNGTSAKTLVQPKIVIFHDEKTLTDYIDAATVLPPAETTHLQLDTVFVGPYDKSFIKQTPEIDYDEILPSDGNTYLKHISSNVSPAVWLGLTLLLAFIVVAAAAFASFKVRKVDAIDKQLLIQ